MPLTADDLKRACRPNIKTVDIPGLGEVCIRAMTLRDRDSYEKASVDGGGKLPNDFRSQYLSRCLCDIDGNLMFPGPEGVETLQALDASIGSRLFDAAIKHNRMTETDIQDLAKNSTPGQNGDSPSASPGI
jgi:hypothetical protein